MLVVERSDPKESQATALLRASHALMQSLFPPEDNSFLSIEELCAPNVHFYIARRGARVLGTGALAVKLGYGEIKSMFVDPNARGQGVADALLRALHDLARELELGDIKLETGNSLDAALRLYRRHGFTACGPFGDYIANDSSIFMTKTP
jgi:putative acetyltransferase